MSEFGLYVSGWLAFLQRLRLKRKLIQGRGHNLTADSNRKQMDFKWGF